MTTLKVAVTALGLSALALTAAHAAPPAAKLPNTPLIYVDQRHLAN